MSIHDHYHLNPPPDVWVRGVDSAVEGAILERCRQFDKWGIRGIRHSLPDWMTILGEEFGELCKEAGDVRFAIDEHRAAIARGKARDEALQVAAVALAIVQFCETGRA